MKKYFYSSLFLCLLLSGVAYSRPAETMKQRRARLERKYLHKVVDLSANTGFLPEAPLPKEDEPEDMEKYKKTNLFESEDSLSSSSTPRPRQRPVMRKKVNKNWLLAIEEDEDTEDSSSSFFSSKTDDTDTETETSRKRKQRLALLESMRRDAENPSSSGRSSMSWLSSGMNTQDGELPPNAQQGGLFSRYNTPGQDPEGRLLPPNSSSPFGEDTDTESPYSLFGGTPSQDRSAPSANSGMAPSYERRNPYSARKDSFGSSAFPSPFSSSPSGNPSDTSRQPNYVPYQSPSGTSPFPAQNQGKMGGTDPQNNFRRQSSPYQKWKNRAPTQPDPTRGDAFVNEFMPKTGH